MAQAPQEELRLGVAAGVNNLWAVDQHDHLKYRFGLALHVRLDPFTGCIHNVYQIPMQIDEHGHSLERDDYHQDDRKLTPKNLEMDGQLEAGFLYFGGINNGRGPGQLLRVQFFSDAFENMLIRIALKTAADGVF
ncbi:hypothetical protein GGX14DRAFT_393528 [Mycena pura]|uniref:Uncharacterized protein n=1 Tax=Mycena pura TaxID=153505 RepID=A0AAD6YBZ1_9AGAR|nr:hypothetical protein GGX14DRAFT_393528 [Mycena pura]